MPPTGREARVAGAVYLLLVLTGPFTLLYIPRKFIVSGDATATASNILAHEMLFRFGIVTELFGAVVFALLAMALYRLLSGVNKARASLMVNLVLVSVAVAFVNVLNNIAALILARGGTFLAVFDRRQLDALAMLFIRLHSQGNFVNELLWGLWLLPFGLLVMKSGFLPRILGILLVVNCFAYVVASLTWLLLPAYGVAAFTAMTPALFGELWITAWLLINGVKAQPQAAAAS